MRTLSQRRMGTIDRQIETLRTAVDDEKRLTALKYLVHFMGDIHQALHAGWGDDRGGNSYQLRAFASDRCQVPSCRLMARIQRTKRQSVTVLSSRSRTEPRNSIRQK